MDTHHHHVKQVLLFLLFLKYQYIAFQLIFVFSSHFSKHIITYISNVKNLCKISFVTSLFSLFTKIVK